jgi:hypothetical protein
MLGRKEGHRLSFAPCTFKKPSCVGDPVRFQKAIRKKGSQKAEVGNM